jgi:hypothetical protein
MTLGQLLDYSLPVHPTPADPCSRNSRTLQENHINRPRFIPKSHSSQAHESTTLRYIPFSSYYEILHLRFHYRHHLPSPLPHHAHSSDRKRSTQTRQRPSMQLESHRHHTLLYALSTHETQYSQHSISIHGKTDTCSAPRRPRPTLLGRLVQRRRLVQGKLGESR